MVYVHHEVPFWVPWVVSQKFFSPSGSLFQHWGPVLVRVLLKPCGQWWNFGDPDGKNGSPCWKMHYVDTQSRQWKKHLLHIDIMVAQTFKILCCFFHALKAAAFRDDNTSFPFLPRAKSKKENTVGKLVANFTILNPQEHHATPRAVTVEFLNFNWTEVFFHKRGKSDTCRALPQNWIHHL